MLLLGTPENWAWQCSKCLETPACICVSTPAWERNGQTSRILKIVKNKLWYVFNVWHKTELRVKTQVQFRDCDGFPWSSLVSLFGFRVHWPNLSLGFTVVNSLPFIPAPPLHPLSLSKSIHLSSCFPCMSSLFPFSALSHVFCCVFYPSRLTDVSVNSIFLLQC